MSRKYYCHVCDKVDSYQHAREHFNWYEFATKEEVARAAEREMGWINLLNSRCKYI